MGEDSRSAPLHPSRVGVPRYQEHRGATLFNNRDNRDRDGSMLDNTLILFGSGASTTHKPRNLPTLIARGGNSGLKHGVYWRDGETRMSNLYLSVLRSLGIEQESFADSTSTFAGSIFSRV